MFPTLSGGALSEPVTLPTGVAATTTAGQAATISAGQFLAASETTGTTTGQVATLGPGQTALAGGTATAATATPPATIMPETATLAGSVGTSPMIGIVATLATNAIGHTASVSAAFDYRYSADGTADYAIGVDGAINCSPCQ